MHDAVDVEGPPAGPGRHNEDREREPLGPVRRERAIPERKAIVRPSFILRLICRLIPEA
jgi:hypothetical protein